MTNVRETKRADELKEGDWTIHLGRFREFEGLGRAEILFVYPYTDEVGNARVYVTVSEVGYSEPQSARINADEQVQILTEDEVRAGREEAERAQKIADIRAYANWLESNPAEPVGYGMGGQVDVEADSEAEAVAKVRAFAVQYGAEVRDALDDRTSARLRLGSVEHVVIAWHPEGRPVESESEAGR